MSQLLSAGVEEDTCLIPSSGVTCEEEDTCLNYRALACGFKGSCSHVLNFGGGGGGNSRRACKQWMEAPAPNDSAEGLGFRSSMCIKCRLRFRVNPEPDPSKP
jgi:hypothetical protein